MIDWPGHPGSHLPEAPGADESSPPPLLYEDEHLRVTGYPTPAQLGAVVLSVHRALDEVSRHHPWKRATRKDDWRILYRRLRGQDPIATTPPDQWLSVQDMERGEALSLLAVSPAAALARVRARAKRLRGGVGYSYVHPDAVREAEMLSLQELMHWITDVLLVWAGDARDAVPMGSIRPPCPFHSDGKPAVDPDTAGLPPALARWYRLNSIAAGLHELRCGRVDGVCLPPPCTAGHGEHLARMWDRLAGFAFKLHRCA
jgi:hypothetical protein